MSRQDLIRRLREAAALPTGLYAEAADALEEDEPLLNLALKPVAWAMPSKTHGLLLDIITPEEHDREPGEYNVPLYTLKEEHMSEAIEASQMNEMTDNNEVPDWNNPTIAGLVLADARNRIVIDMVWQLIENPEHEFTQLEMGYFCSLHAALKNKLLQSHREAIAQQVQEPLPKITRISEGLSAVTVGDCLAYGDARVATHLQSHCEAIAKKDAALRDALIRASATLHRARRNSTTDTDEIVYATAAKNLDAVIDAIAQAKEAIDKALGAHHEK